MSSKMTMPKTAMLLSAGYGKRMRPLTDDKPKPLIEVGGRTMLDRALDRMVDAGVEKVVVNLHYKGAMIRDHLADRKDVEILFSEEETLMETGGGVKQALKLLGKGPFIVANSDTVWLDGPSSALGRMAVEWNPKEMDALLLLHSGAAAWGYEGVGDFTMDEFGRIARREEILVAPFVFTGVQFLTADLFKDTPDGPFSLNLVYDRLIETERLYGIAHDGEWHHVGTPFQLAMVEQQFGDPSTTSDK
jgi:MurNAc alpha-1-phosphate uridylyltransferase